MADIWSKDDEKYFYERYLQAENNQPQYLFNQAASFFFANDPSAFDIVIRLLDKYFTDFPDDKDYKVPALHIMGKICYNRKEYEKAFQYYKNAAESEIENPESVSGAWLNYVECIIKFDKVELYDEAVRYMNIYYDSLPLSEQYYLVNTFLAAIAQKNSDDEKYRYYNERANLALKELTALNKRLRYVRVIKTDYTNKDTNEYIREFLQNKGFVFGQRNGEPVWFRKVALGIHHIMPVCLHDVVIITAFISYRDGLSGIEIENGLNGFIGCLIKLPLKKTVKQLEKLIENNFGANKS